MDIIQEENKELMAQIEQTSSLLPTTAEEASQVEDLFKNQPMVVFNRMREVMAELTFLTDMVDQPIIDSNPEVQEALTEDFTQLLEQAQQKNLIAHQKMNLQQIQEADINTLDKAEM